MKLWRGIPIHELLPQEEEFGNPHTRQEYEQWLDTLGDKKPSTEGVENGVERS